MYFKKSQQIIQTIIDEDFTPSFNIFEHYMLFLRTNLFMVSIGVQQKI